MLRNIVNEYHLENWLIAQAFTKTIFKQIASSGAHIYSKFRGTN